MKKCGWREFLTAGSLSAVVAVILPLQTYLGNSAIFPFSLVRLLPELLAIFAVFTVGLLLLAFLPEKLSKHVDAIVSIALKLKGPSLFRLHLFSPPAFFFSLLAASLLCVYLESGLLSMGLPELNGGPVAELANRTRGAVDAGVWVAVVAVFLVFARKLRPYLHWISLAVLVLSLAALADVAARSSVDATSSSRRNEERATFVDATSSSRRNEENSTFAGRGGDAASTVSYESQPTVVANVKYSPVRNILVFVLDSMPGAATVDVLRMNSELARRFAGFTAYPDNIGMHECTKRGVPGLVTGRHFDPSEISEADYPMTMYSANSFVTVAAAAGWNVAFSPDLLPYGATNLPVGQRVARQEKRRSRDRFAFLRQTTEVPFLSLFDTVAFRLSPFLFKGPILYSRIRHAVKGRHSNTDFWGERVLYPQLASRPVGAETRPFLGFFHSWGAHPPWTAGFAATVKEKFTALAQLMEAYRAAGIYDKSLIVVTSDHGLDQAPPPEGYPPSASALLLVKPEGASAPFAVSSARTSHAKIAPLVKAALAAPLAASACEAILREEHPLYRAEIREGSREYFRDWKK